MSDKQPSGTTYTPGQVSEMLDLPPSTVRRYSTEWSSYLSEGAQVSGKRRLYTDGDVLTLRRIRQLTSQRKTPEQIAAGLAIVDEPVEPGSALAILPQVFEAFEAIRSQLAQMSDDQAALRDEIEQLRADLEDARRPWLRKLAGRIFRK